MFTTHYLASIATPFYSRIVASSSSHFSHEFLRRRGKREGAPRCSTQRTRGPNKEILDKSREVFAVRRSCLHYSCEYVRLSRSSFLSFCLVASVPFGPPALLASLCRRRTFGILLLRIRRFCVSRSKECRTFLRIWKLFTRFVP